MGLFDDLTNIMSEANSLRDEVTKAGSDLAKDFVAGVTEIQQSAASTTASVNGTMSDDPQIETASPTPTDEQQNI
jgi:hypothetical protein